VTTPTDQHAVETRFRLVFAHHGALVAYARRRGSLDPEGLAAEALAIAWRRLADVPHDDPLPWLYATSRNLLRAEWRRERRFGGAMPEGIAAHDPVAVNLDPELDAALRALSASDREALLLVAWEDLTPAQAAYALGITPAAFRIRLLRARRRLRTRLVTAASARPPSCRPVHLDVEEA
jgi:RNA polymerase sigma-70 factor (ECF subfamily)